MAGKWSKKDRPCMVDGCNRKHSTFGWCNKHYQRWLRTDDPTAAGYDLFRNSEDSFKARTRRAESGCIEWIGALSGGYGNIRSGGKVVRAHRYAWERANGPIPDGMMVDHICWNRACVEVSHLRLATNKQNTENLSGARSDSATGIRGVGYIPSLGKWRAKVGHNGTELHVGYFLTSEEASRAAATKRAEVFTHSQN